MKNYVILNNNNSINEYICFMNTVEDVEYSLDEITKDMKDLGCTRIIIDLFLTNGYSFNRFFPFSRLKIIVTKRDTTMTNTITISKIAFLVSLPKEVSF